MRARSLFMVVGALELACAQIATDEMRTSEGRDAASAMGGFGSTIQAPSPTVPLRQTDAAPAIHPEYTRPCIEATLARNGSISSDAGSLTPIHSADASSRVQVDGAVDLELGAGDLTVLVIFDKSGSMGDYWDEGTKWEVANEAFLKAIEPVIDNLTIGTIFFPQPNGCSVLPLESPLQMNYRPGAQFASLWRETEGSRSPDGSTPLELAFRYADLAIEQACALSLLDDRFRVVLITDGEPTCDDDTTAIVNLTAEWNRLGVETWVMGLPGSSNASALLDAIAFSGATGQAQVIGTPQALDEGLSAAVQ